MWSPWINLAYDDEEMVDNASPVAAEQPSYPWGTRLCLTGRELEMAKLPLPKRGELIDMRIMAEVTSVTDGEGGQRIELQITMMKLELEDDDEDDDD